MDETDRRETNNINQIITVPSTANNQDLVQRSNSKGVNNKKRGKENMLSNQSTNSTVSTDNVANTASKRPKNTALKQQRLPAWQPILTAKTVLPLFFTIGVIFVVLGGVLLHYSDIVNERIYDYTDCTTSNGSKCSLLNQNNPNQNCICSITFTLDTDYAAPVYIYYGLKNFYQNHRRYVKSRDDNQLLGKTYSSVNTECTPYDKLSNGSFYAPCGAIANSLFNDTFQVYYNSPTAGQVNVSLLNTGIAWTTDKNIKFRNPSSWANTVRPKNWNKNVQDLDPSNPDNTGYQNEDLIVWMRTAALPTFRKFHRRVNHSDIFKDSLPAGNYTLTINYNYPVTMFDGRKSFIISTTSWIGGKNPFLGIAYLVVGSLCICLGFIFLIIHFKFSRNSKPADDSPGNRANHNVTNIAVVDSQEKSF